MSKRNRIINENEIRKIKVKNQQMVYRNNDKRKRLRLKGVRNCFSDSFLGLHFFVFSFLGFLTLCFATMLRSVRNPEVIPDGVSFPLRLAT